MDTKKLRQKILDLAIRGKLVPQDPNDEPASVLLERIRAEKERLINEGKIKRSKKSAPSDTPHYENVPFEVPEGWVWCRLSEIANYGGGKTPSMDNKQYWSNGTNLWITSKDMKCERITDSMMKISNDALDIMTQYEPGTLLMVTRSGILRHSLPIAILEEKATVNQDLKTISLHLKETHEYVYYAIKARERYILKEYHKDGTTVDSINFEKFAEILLPIPPYDEQKRIVIAIKKWLSFIDQLEQNANELETSIQQTKKKILEFAMHGKLVPQDPNDEPAIELLKRINPKFTPCDNAHYENVPSNWAVCKLEDIINYEQPQEYIVQSTDYKTHHKTPVLTAGKSFIIGYTNEDFGICSNLPVIIFDDFTTDSKYVDFPFKVKSSAMKILHVNEDVNIQYVCWFMSITRLVGDTHKRYWISEYSKLHIPIPPRNEQDRIINKVNELFQILDNISAEL